MSASQVRHVRVIAEGKVKKEKVKSRDAPRGKAGRLDPSNKSATDGNPAAVAGAFDRPGGLPPGGAPWDRGKSNSCLLFVNIIPEVLGIASRWANYLILCVCCAV